MTTPPPVPLDPRRCVVIPSYNSGPLLERTVREVLAFWRPVLVVIDGSTDGSGELPETEGLEILRLTPNHGKGAALQVAFAHAANRGFTHAATFDADGQHCAADLPRFMEISRSHPRALIAGLPVFNESAPGIRVLGHRIANFWTRLESGGRGPADSLCGFRVYPLAATARALSKSHPARGFDFETVAGVRLAQQDAPCLNVPTPIRYARTGVSHFRYVRDNCLLVRTHARLLVSALPFYAGLSRTKIAPLRHEPMLPVVASE